MTQVYEEIFCLIWHNFKIADKIIEEIYAGF